MSSARRGGPGRGFWISLGLLVVVGISVLSWLATRPKAVATTIDPSLPPVKSEGYVMGNAAAPVEVIEFADFECPGCGQFSLLTEPDVRARLVNTGQIRMRFLDFPLEMHKNTWDASLAAACANDQGKFWEMHDQIFATQDRWNTQATSRPRKPLAELAKGLGLDMSKYDACMDANTHLAKIQAHKREGDRRQVAQTPTFVIGTKQIPGSLPFDLFKAYVDSALKSAPAARDSAKKAP